MYGVEIVKEIGKYQIIKLFANTMYTNDDKENGVSYYGDIYTSKEEVLLNHPNSKVMSGYGIIDMETGFIPDDTPDWFNSVDEATSFIEGSEM